MNPSVIPGTARQIENPFPVVGDFVRRFKKPTYPALIPRPADVMAPEATNVLIRNKMSAPATKPNYGMVAPARF